MGSVLCLRAVKSTPRLQNPHDGPVYCACRTWQCWSSPDMCPLKTTYPPPASGPTSNVASKSTQPLPSCSDGYPVPSPSPQYCRPLQGPPGTHLMLQDRM